MIRCDVCGCTFNALTERHYTARDAGKEGLAAAFGSNPEPQIFDAFDCPQCGCQNIVQPRKRPCNPGKIYMDILLESMKKAGATPEELKSVDRLATKYCRNKIYDEENP